MFYILYVQKDEKGLPDCL